MRSTPSSFKITPAPETSEIGLALDRIEPLGFGMTRILVLPSLLALLACSAVTSIHIIEVAGTSGR
jgi:hypothetical protein